MSTETIDLLFVTVTDLADFASAWDTGSQALVLPAQVWTFLSLYWVLATEAPDFLLGMVNLVPVFVLEAEGVSK